MTDLLSRCDNNTGQAGEGELGRTKRRDCEDGPPCHVRVAHLLGLSCQRHIHKRYSTCNPPGLLAASSAMRGGARDAWRPALNSSRWSAAYWRWSLADANPVQVEQATSPLLHNTYGVQVHDISVAHLEYLCILAPRRQHQSSASYDRFFGGPRPFPTRTTKQSTSSVACRLFYFFSATLKMSPAPARPRRKVAAAQGEGRRKKTPRASTCYSPRLHSWPLHHQSSLAPPPRGRMFCSEL